PAAVELGPRGGRHHCHAPPGPPPGSRRLGAATLSAEILGALLSVLSIWVVTGVLVYLAAQRLLSGDYDLDGTAMLVTSACAVAVNVPEYKFVDPICTFLFSVLVLGTTLSILRDVLLVLMEGTPRGMDFNAVRETLLAVGGVRALHSLHIWALTASRPLLSVHVAIRDAREVLEEAGRRLRGAFGFHATTIQVERYCEDMRDCRECQSPGD
uniref:Solute carrier family 30 member 2 n=1 Tax=Dromaius novaehollandiae TaxID=8790 RepID=A0A8C4P748_DRONO